MEEDDSSVPDHKLCGFVFAVLSITPPIPNTPISQTLPINTRCDVYGDGTEIVGFRAENGVILTVVNPDATALVAPADSTPPQPSNKRKKRSTKKGSASGVDSERNSAMKKWRRIGMVQGSLSVVRQLHQLVAHKCLKVIARVVKTVSGYCGEARAVLLVDVYLPIAVWNGWQFPKSATIAAALFRHLSDDWAKRRSVIVGNEIVCNFDHEDDKGIWNLSDCHVLGCRIHCGSLDTSKRKLFEIHEIFKSLPRVGQETNAYSSRINPADGCFTSGIWDIADDVLINILNALGPTELVRMSVTCHHLRLLAKSIMPCMKLKLFPHQQAAVEWMLQREQDPRVLPHPLYMRISTDDGFAFCVNTVSGELVTGSAPTIRDFRGGMFCDEPGLGKTITALSLILKTQGTMADPPDGQQVTWCAHNSDQRCGYYELSGDNGTTRRGTFTIDEFSPRESFTSCSQDRASCVASDIFISESDDQHSVSGVTSPAASSTQSRCVVRCRKSLNNNKKKTLKRQKSDDDSDEDWEVAERAKKRKSASNGQRSSSKSKQVDRSLQNTKMDRNSVSNRSNVNETWVQCEACRKWRKLANTSVTDATTAWFCSMNSDPLHQSCNVPEEPWNFQSITELPGFYTKGTPGGKEDNISFFTSVLKEHYTLMKSETKRALTWLAKLSPEKLSQMETVGLIHPVLDTRVLSRGREHAFHKLFQAFGLKKQEEKGITRWYYPSTLKNLVFDLAALQIALCEPLDSSRLYLSRATLIVVPSNLVDHWKTQIEKHVRPGQLRVYIWTDNKRPSVHNLAWDYDVVITTFTRLSAEWSPRRRSALMQVHWHRLLLDEGHTLGSSLNLTNKLQMAISLTASCRWLLTGTPTPNTPNSQLSHLQPMLKFLHEEAYGENQKSWETGILRPFEAEMEEGRSRLLQLLQRCMISERKADLQSIPPCIKKVTFVDFTEEHAASYNELVVTVRRNILMADWNDPSHVESLLNPKQWKFRGTTIKNVRLSCCVAGHIKISEAGHDIQETMDILVQNGLDPISEVYAFIRHNILKGGGCMRCKEWCRLPVITPCKHLLCLDCVALDSEKCTFPGCDNLYEMQSPEILTRPENPNPKWPVPKDLIELQPSYKQDDWDPDWQSTSSSKVAYLVQRLKDLQEANEMLAISQDEENDFRHVDEPFPSRKRNYGALLAPEAWCRSSYESSKTFPHKVIIFSQFLEHIHVIEQQLSIAGIRFTGMYSPMPNGNKMKSLATFQYDASCMALVMDGSAALGLDLSFVNHVFLMEPIWDRSMEEQVISRAHRMGATRPIHVETLAMRGTLEEQMLKFLQDADECRRLLREEVDKSEREGSRPHRTLHDFAESSYLAHLSFVRTSSKT